MIATFYKQKLVLRVLALAVLMMCVVVISRTQEGAQGLRSREGKDMAQKSSAMRNVAIPTITVQEQNDSPLVISSVGVTLLDSESVEFGYNLLNVSSKPIMAYAIHQDIRDDAGQVKGSETNLRVMWLTSPVIEPARSKATVDASGIAAERETIILSVDYVEFSDGTNWGKDTRKFSERLAGMKYAAHLVSTRLLETLDATNAKDAAAAMDQAANVPEPVGKSDTWIQGFHAGIAAVTDRLKRVEENGGLDEFGRAVRRIAESARGVD
jgi:hypothetical protein